MDRLSLIRRHLPISHGRGLEFGPLDKPIVHRGEGTVFYADFLSTEALKAQHASSPYANADAIETVDLVLGRAPLRELLTAVSPLDYVVASHVFEHVPNPIQWLQDISANLKPGGIISLAIPDKRFTFDYLRQLSRPSELIANYLTQVDFPTAIQALDNNLNVVKLDAGMAWRGEVDPASLEHHYSPRVAVEYYEATFKKGVFADCHCTVWTHDHFVETMSTLEALGFTDLLVRTSTPAARYADEFFALLEKPKSKSTPALSPVCLRAYEP